jgi:hypothetical protein
MSRQKYHVLLFFLSIPFPFMLFKGWWSGIFDGWGTQGYVYLGLFAVLAEIYFSTRKLVNAGMIGIGVFLVGLIFKVQHWPGAQICVLLSTILLIAIPIWSALLNPHDRKLNIIISTWILIFGISALFKMFHWPSAGLLTVVSMMILPVVTISLGIDLWKTKTVKA